MNSSTGLRRSSDEERFTALANTLREFDRQTAELETRQQALERQFGQLIKTIASRPSAGAPVLDWVYDARQLNYYFPDVYDVEIGANTARRWVGESGILKANLTLPRNAQYDFSIQVVSFALPEYEDAVYLRVDDQDYRWLSIKDHKYETIILEDPNASELTFEVGVFIGRQADKDVTFSFSGIEIRRRV